MRLQVLDEEKLKSFLIDLYKDLIRQYHIDRDGIPAGQLIEIKYEELMQDPETRLKDMALKLKLGLDPEFEKAKPYLIEARNYVSRDYAFTPDYVQWINHHLSDLIELQGYPLKGHKSEGTLRMAGPGN